MGQAIRVPIIIRSLAGSMAVLEEDQMPIGLDREFLMMLDADLSEQNVDCQIVDEYECAWWKGRKPRSLDLALVLDRSSLDKCLEKHQKQLINEIQPTSFTGISAYIPGSADIRGSSANIPGPSASNQCLKCDRYSQILSNALQDILDMHNFADTMTTCSEAQWNIDMRRASTFNLLHEAVVIKEMDDPMGDKSSASSALLSPNVIKNVGQTAKRELARLQSLPTSSHKWTWGEKLSEAEVLALRRSGTRPNERMHSGYDLSLIHGKDTGVASPLPSMPSSINEQQNVGLNSTMAMPDYNFPDVAYFKRKQNMLYDPLGKTRDVNPSAIPLSTTLAKLTSENVIAHTQLSYANHEPLSDETPRVGNADGNAETPAKGIEDMWFEESEGIIQRPSQNIETPVVRHVDRNTDTPTEGIEDLWFKESENIYPPSQNIETPVLGNAERNAETPVEGIANLNAETPVDGIEDLWFNESEENIQRPPPNIVTPEIRNADENAEMHSAYIEDMWFQDGDTIVQNTSTTMVGTTLGRNADVNAEAPAQRIEDMWVEESEENAQTAKVALIEDLWFDDTQENVLPSHTDAEDKAIESVSSASGDDDKGDADTVSSQQTPNSQFVVSPSRITIKNSYHSFPLSGVWPDLDTNTPILDASASQPFRRFGPEDFRNLKDHMFEDKLSDSESEYEDYGENEEYEEYEEVDK
jgi:hypothetical protein